MKTRDFEKFLIEKGYSQVNSNSHKKFAKGSHTVMVVHGRDMNKMVVKRLLKEIERNREDLNSMAG